MTYKKTNEAYFGDSFIRPYTVACYNSNGDEVMKGYIKDCDLSLSADSATEVNCTFDLAKGLSSTAYGLANSKSGDLHCSGVVKASDYAIEMVTDSLCTELKKIQTQIDDLKQNCVPKIGVNKLRSALKTLNYTREI